MSDYLHKEYPKTRPRNDFLGQVKRTINGQPVSQEQVDMIIDSIKKNLGLVKSEDVLLDLGCGNGYLAHFLFDSISHYHGIDFSEYLIEIAKENFENPPYQTFKVSDILSFVSEEIYIYHFNKCLCYGCFSYLEENEAKKVLKLLYNRFPCLDYILIGNIPDKDKAKFFFKEENPILNDNQSSTGIWRTKYEMFDLVNSTGWDISFHTMPNEFYASSYRYDVTLSRTRI